MRTDEGSAHFDEADEETDPDNGDSSEYRSEDELRAELGKLNQKAAERLLGIARNRATGTGLAAEDLFHMSLERLLAGQRRWRRDESLAHCIARTVKSLVMDWWRRQERVPIRNETDLGKEDAAKVEAATHDAPSVERALIARQELEEIMAVLKDDKNTLEVAMMVAEGESPAEIRTAYGLTQTQYDTVLKRIVRARKKMQKTGGGR
jgi:RNA polymerase sigma factor (sigma-70 family)